MLSKCLDHGKALSYSASHPDPRYLHMALVTIGMLGSLWVNTGQSTVITPFQYFGTILSFFISLELSLIKAW